MTALRFNATAKSVHEVDDLGGSLMLGRHNLLASLFALDQLAQRILVPILKLFGMEVPAQSVDDVACQLDHLLWRRCLFNLAEILVLVADLVGVAQKRSHETLAAWFKGNDMLAR